MQPYCEYLDSYPVRFTLYIMLHLVQESSPFNQGRMNPAPTDPRHCACDRLDGLFRDAFASATLGQFEPSTLDGLVVFWAAVACAPAPP